MIRKLLIVLALLSAVAVSAGLLGITVRYAARNRAANKCREVSVGIEREGAMVYMQPKDVRAWLEKYGFRLEGSPVRSLETARIESALRRNPYVREAEVFVTEDGVLHLEVWQRNPSLKVINLSQQLFQIDDRGVEMPDNPGYRSRLRVASGYIPYAPLYGSDVDDIPDSLGRSMLKKLFHINRYLEEDPLWNALFEQIYVTASGEIELIPKVGGQLVRLGRIADREDLDDKMFRLKLFYQKGMSQEGWQKYSVLSLKYKNQLVATRRAGF